MSEMRDYTHPRRPGDPRAAPIVFHSPPQQKTCRV
jgi:hypothetical protein